LAPSCRRPSAKRRRLGGLRRTKPRSRRTLLEARRRARQSIREYELIWLLQQRLRAVSWPHWRLRCMQPLHGHRPRHGSCQTLITLTRRPLSVSRAPHVLSSRVLCLAPPAVDLLEALGRCVCTRRACCFCLRMSQCSAATGELLPRGWRAVAFPWWLHVQSCSTWLVVILIVRCCFGGLCVRDRLAACLRMSGCRTSAAFVEPLPGGSRAVAFPRWLHVLSCSTWLIVRCCINSCVLGRLAS